MPIYEYKCPNCGVFEVMQKITDDPLKTCPTCGTDVKKLVSRCGVIYKCGGFHCTDYKWPGTNKDKPAV